MWILPNSLLLKIFGCTAHHHHHYHQDRGSSELYKKPISTSGRTKSVSRKQLFMKFRELTSEFTVWQNAETPIVPPRGTYSYLTDFENVKLLVSSGYKNCSCSIALSDSVTSSAPSGGPVRVHDIKLQDTVIVGCYTMTCFCTNSP
jgi:hypothetical protein